MNSPRHVSITIPLKMTDKAAAFYKAAFDYPFECPVCHFTHDSKLWVRKDEHLECDNCGSILLVTFPQQ